MKRWLVIRLVRQASRGWGVSYAAYCTYGPGSRITQAATGLAIRRERAALKLARALDPENRWIGAEMAEHGWWG